MLPHLEVCTECDDDGGACVCRNQQLTTTTSTKIYIYMFICTFI